MRALSPFAVDLGFLVEEYASSKGVIPPKRRRKLNTVYVCTIEKAHTLLNSLIANGRQQQLGLMVVDEVSIIVNNMYMYLYIIIHAYTYI